MSGPDKSRVNRAQNLFVFSPATHLPDVSSIVSAANRRHQLRALFVEENAELTWLPQLLERANLRTLRNMLVHSSWEVPKRILTAWIHDAEDELIADASVIDEQLLVRSCKLDTYEVSFRAAPVLKRIPVRNRRDFEIDEDGSYIYWPSADIHLDLDGIRVLTDPEYRAAAYINKRNQDRLYGEAIASLRKEAGLRVVEMGMSDRHLRRIESGKSTISNHVVEQLAKAHSLTPAQYLDAVARRRQDILKMTG